MHNFLFNNDNDSERLNFNNDFDGTIRNNSLNNSNEGLLANLLRSDNTEILLFLIIFLLLFTTFGRR